MNMILSPSILSADFTRLGEQIREADEAGAQYIHIDVMDGIFVPSISYGMPLISSIRRVTERVLDVHLMITMPERFLEDFAACGADILTFHVESTKKPDAVIETIHKLGMKAGITLRPDTPVSEIADFIPSVDMVLVMTVEPGRGGQTLLPHTLGKIREIRRMIERQGLLADVEADGGINHENIREVIQAGANVIVAGSAVFRGDIGENIRKLNIYK